MKQLFLNVKDGSTKLLDQPIPIVKENMALVESLYTVVSAGTERGLASFGGKNLVQKAMERSLLPNPYHDQNFCPPSLPSYVIATDTI